MKSSCDDFGIEQTSMFPISTAKHETFVITFQELENGARTGRYDILG
jgi:hypothetical protein